MQVSYPMYLNRDRMMFGVYIDQPLLKLYTIILGPYMAKLTTKQKSWVQCPDYRVWLATLDIQISATTISLLLVTITCKAFAQLAPFIVTRFVSRNEMRMWLCLSKVKVVANSSLPPHTFSPPQLGFHGELSVTGSIRIFVRHLLM